MKTAAALLEAEADMEVEDGKGTYGSVCVALAFPEVLRSAVTFWVPSARFKCSRVRWNMAKLALGW